MLDHHEVAVEVDGSGRDFTAIVASVPTKFTGRYIAVEDRCIALVVDGDGPVARRDGLVPLSSDDRG